MSSRRRRGTGGRKEGGTDRGEGRAGGREGEREGGTRKKRVTDSTRKEGREGEREGGRGGGGGGALTDLDGGAKGNGFHVLHREEGVTIVEKSRHVRTRYPKGVSGGQHTQAFAFRLEVLNEAEAMVDLDFFGGERGEGGRRGGKEGGRVRCSAVGAKDERD